MTRASKPWASAMASVESAMRSRVTSEYFMPIWPMAMPSHTAMAGKTIGVPPAMATPILTASTILSMFMWPGTISLYELTMPTSGRAISSSVRPSAWYSERCAPFMGPNLMASDLTFIEENLSLGNGITLYCTTRLFDTSFLRPTMDKSSHGHRSITRVLHLQNGTQRPQVSFRRSSAAAQPRGLSEYRRKPGPPGDNRPQRP